MIALFLFIAPSCGLCAENEGAADSSTQENIQKPKPRRVLTREDKMRRSALRHMTARRKAMIKKASEKPKINARRVHKAGTMRMLSREDKMRRSALRHVMLRRKKMTENAPQAPENEPKLSQALVERVNPQFFFIQNRLPPVPVPWGAGKMMRI
jgi:DNA-binding phage protein